jgi:hypothetical protein
MTESDFPVPQPVDFRDQYQALTEPFSKGNTWQQTHVTVRSGGDAVAAYDRNYQMMRTFEPFRQLRDGEWRPYALISHNYTQSSVLDLRQGLIIAEEPEREMVKLPSGREIRAEGFCPVGFYVPDWWDLNDGSILPGNEYWESDNEWATGELGFVWGCIWGDDTSWKVEALDLSRITEGVITRDARWGYLELNTHSDDPRDFIDVDTEMGAVTFTVPTRFSLTGEKR